MMQALYKHLYRPIDIASLAFLRIMIGILAFADLLGTWIYYHFWHNAFDPDQFQFTYYGFQWVNPLPEPFMSVLFVVLLGLSIAVTLGWHFRATAPLLFVGFCYTFLLEKAHYLNHGYLFCWVLLVIAISPSWRECSLDVWRKPEKQRSQVPFWTLGIPLFLMSVVYFFGGLAKINPDWLRAMPLKLWLQAKVDTSVIGPILEYEITAYFMAYGGLLLDLFVVPLLWWRRSRWLAFGMVLFFHFVNFLIFNIGIFPFLSVTLTSLFFPPSWPRQLLQWIGKKWSFLGKWQEIYRQRVVTETIKAPIWQADHKWRNVVLAGLALLVCVQVFLPLRHHFLGKDVAWDENGHRYAWRMMLRSKSGHARFIVVNQQGDSTKVSPRKELSNKQARKMPTHPDMILQYAHHLRDQYDAQAVYADIRIRLNGGSYTPYIDPEANLVEEEWCFIGVPDWVLER